MASALLASSRNESFWGEPQVYMRKNPSPNPNPRLASDNRSKDRLRGISASSPIADRIDRAAEIEELTSAGYAAVSAGSDDSSSLNHRRASRKPSSNHHQYFNRSSGNESGYENAYVTLDIATYSRRELQVLKRRLISELEQVRSLNNRIKSGELQPARSTCLSTSGYGGGNGGGREVTSAAVASRPPPVLVGQSPVLDSPQTHNASDRRTPKGGNHFLFPAVESPTAGGADNKYSFGKRSLPLTSPREAKRQATGESEKILAAMMKKCYQILTKLMKHRYGWVFNTPVDVTGLGLHDYYQIIKRPMDLGTVKSKLGKRFYTSPLEFATDVRLTFNNALLYNPEGHDVHKMADQLLHLFEKLFADACKAYEKQGQSYGKGEEEERKQGHSRSGSGGHVPREEATSRVPLALPNLPSANKAIPCPQSPATARSPLHPAHVQPVASPVKPELPTQQPILTRVAMGKQPKPKAKDPNKREMSFEEKKKLSLGLQSLPQEKMAQVLQIVQRRNPDPALHGDEIELDFDDASLIFLVSLSLSLLSRVSLCAREEEEAKVLWFCPGSMRTPRAGGQKKTPPGKRNAASTAVTSLPSTPEMVPGSGTRTTPRSGPGSREGRGGGRRSNTRASAASTTSDPPPEAPREVDADLVLRTDQKDAVEEVEAVGELEAISASPDKSETVESPSLQLDRVKEESQMLIEETDAPVSMEADEQEEPLSEKECEEEGKTVVSDEQEPEEPPVHEKGEETVDVIKGDESGTIADADESKSDFGENLEEESGGKEVILESEEKNVEECSEQEVEVPGDEETAVVEKESEILGEEEQVEMLDVIKERNKKKEREIFVGGLDRNATEDDVRKVFEKIGVVEEIRLHKDVTTNKNKGFAFVKFADKEQADRALSELKNPTINGKKCGIARSEDNDTLFVGNICNTWTKEAVKQRLKDFGIEGVESINLVGDSQSEGLSRGFAFVEFSCHEYAMNAYKRLQKPDVVLGHPEWTAKVAFAEPLREPDPEVMAQVKSVFVDGMPPSWDEDRVKELFKDYGEIEGIVLARNMPTAKRTDFGFVNYATHEAAVACVDAVNDKELGDGKTKIKVRARLANPLPKTQAVKGGMRGGFRIGHAGISGFPRAGRGFGRGRAPFARGGFQGSRGFHGTRGFPFHGHARGGRFPFFPEGPVDSSNFRFRGQQPFLGRGGRGPFRGNYGGINEEFPPRFENNRARHGGFGRGRGRHFHTRGEPLPYEGDFHGPSHDGPFAEDPFYYGYAGRGVKRPFSMGEPRFMDPGSRVRPRYNLSGPTAGDARYQDLSRGSDSMYPRDYYGPNYGGSGYPPVQGGESSGSQYY